MLRIEFEQNLAANEQTGSYDNNEFGIGGEGGSVIKAAPTTSGASQSVA